MKKLKKWSLITFIVLFIVYGFVYHTYFMFFMLFLIIGIGYLIYKYGKKIIDQFNDMLK